MPLGRIHYFSTCRPHTHTHTFLISSFIWWLWQEFLSALFLFAFQIARMICLVSRWGSWHRNREPGLLEMSPPEWYRFIFLCWLPENLWPRQIRSCNIRYLWQTSRKIMVVLFRVLSYVVKLPSFQVYFSSSFALIESTQALCFPEFLLPKYWSLKV